jgi:hypothetical protein
MGGWMFSIDLKANVTRYAQQNCKWCGAAAVEMVRNGYPSPADRLFYPQSDLWAKIQVNNSSLPADISAHWDTDPQGLKGCLRSLANPSGVDWLELADADGGAVLLSAIYAMKVTQYPVPVLIDNGGHWVVIVGYETDIEPVSGGDPTLLSICYYDPWPPCVGAVTTSEGYQWFAYPWKYSILYRGSWYNQYVAVIEQPSRDGTFKGVVKGTVSVNAVKQTGRKLLSRAEAVAKVQRWIKELKLDGRPECSVLARSDVDNLEPAIVREEMPDGRAKNVGYYYIVPYGLKTEFSDRGSRLARVCVLVNAYTGKFEEVTAFGAPVRYLTADEALAVVGAAIQVDSRNLSDAEITLMFQPSGITHSRAFPFWRVAVAGRVLYVDQFGQLHGRLLPGMPGN